MKTYRQVVLLVYCAAVLVTCVYLPWKADPGGVRYNSRFYHFLWDPPQIRVDNYNSVDASVDITRVGLELLAITALTGFALLIAEVGQRLKLTIAFPSWVTRKTVFSAITVLTIGVGSMWGFYRHWQEQQRIRQIAEQKATCDSIRDHCLEKAPMRVKRTGDGILHMYRDENCGGDLALKQKHDTCLATVHALQTEQERQRDEQQQRQGEKTIEDFLWTPLPSDKEG